MFERFTKRARRVVVVAQEHARQRQDDVITTDHLWLALADEPAIAEVINRFNLDISEAVDLRLEKRADNPRQGHIPFTADVKKFFSASLRIAMAYGHRGIDVQHQLLALMRLDDNETAADLRDRASYDEVASVVLDELQEETDSDVISSVTATGESDLDMAEALLTTALSLLRRMKD